MKRKTLLLLICALTALLLFACSIETPSESNDCEVSNIVTSSTVESSSQSHADASTAKSSTDESSLDESSMQEESIPEEVVKKIDAYTTISKAGDKQIATVFDETFIADIKTRREQGEILCLSDEEIKCIIKNTLSLFETYDIVRIYDIQGNTHTYYGSPFYHSAEYFASFGVTSPATEATFDYKKDLLETILKCVEVLHSNIYDGRDDFSKFVLNTSRTFTENEEKEILGALNSIYELNGSSETSKAILSKYQFSAFYFDIKEEELIFIPLISAAAPSTKVSLITNEMLPAKISPKKYDYNGQVIVIELYNNHTNSLVVRLRYDEKNNPEVLKKANELFYASIPNLSGAGNIFQKTQYKAVVYFNVFSFNYADTCISYAPDGDLNIFTFNDPYDLLYSLQNSKPLTEYLNQLLSDYLED